MEASKHLHTYDIYNHEERLTTTVGERVTHKMWEIKNVKLTTNNINKYITNTNT